MTAFNLYSKFKTLFPWFAPKIVKYKAHKPEGIDVYLNSHEVLYFNIDKKGKWILKKEVDYCAYENDPGSTSN